MKRVMRKIKFLFKEGNSSFIMFFGINRIINYEVLNAIPKDTQTLYYNAARLLNKGVGIVKLMRLQNWL